MNENHYIHKQHKVIFLRTVGDFLRPYSSPKLVLNQHELTPLTVRYRNQDQFAFCHKNRLLITNVGTLLRNNWPNLIPTVEKVIYRQWMYKVHPVSIQPRQSTVKYQRLYNVGCTTGPTFFRLWKKLFSDSKCTRSTKCLIDSDN